MYIEAVDWTYLDQGQVQWRSHVNTVVNLLDLTRVTSSESFKWLWR
jgi:hypothetical protein